MSSGGQTRRGSRRVLALVPVCAVLASVSALAPLTPEPALPGQAISSPGALSFPRANGKIAFRQSIHLGFRHLRQEIWLMEPDGSGATRILAGRDNEWYGPVGFSPNGQRLIVAKGSRLAYNAILQMNVDGTDLREIYSCHGVVCPWGPSWSQDGRTILFGAGAHIFTMRSDGTGIRLVRECFWPQCSLEGPPAWSPDGRLIAFARTDSRWHFPGSLYVMDPFHGSTWKVSGCRLERCRGEGFIHESGPTWSPDGLTIAFARERNIWAVGVDGTNLRAVTDCPFVARAADAPCSATSPIWAPDGQAIAFDGKDGIFVVAPDGSGLRSVGPRGAELVGWQGVSSLRSVTAAVGIGSTATCGAVRSWVWCPAHTC